MSLNVEDQQAHTGGKRKFIMVQLPEVCDDKSEAYKAGYKTIAEIGKERIRRAGKKIKAENADKEGIANLDIGFPCPENRQLQHEGRLLHARRCATNPPF